MGGLDKTQTVDSCRVFYINDSLLYCMVKLEYYNYFYMYELEVTCNGIIMRLTTVNNLHKSSARLLYEKYTDEHIRQ